MNCPQCQTENRPEANFCRRCGRLLVDHCPRCGVSLLPDSDFCDHCGRPLTPAAALGWAAGGDRSHALGRQHADQTRFTAPAAPEEAPSVEIPSPAAPNPPKLERYIPEELREKLDAARAAGEMVGERRIVTMLFCDVKGSTAAAGHLDPEEWTEIINGAFELMIKPVYKYEGTVARLMGDGILAFFGAPLTHEDDPRRAVLAGLDIVAHIAAYRQRISQSWGFDLNVRVGINTGLVVVGTVGSDLRMEYTAMGDAINLAARMEQTAEPGTVQIAHDTYKLVKPYFEIQELGGISIKGKTDPVPAYTVSARKAEAGRQRGIDGLQAALVGREIELSALQDILAAVQQAVGHIVCVIGHAGLGKSRLIHEAKRSLGNNPSLNWIETSSLSYENNQPYAPFQRLIRRLNNISPSDSAEQTRQKLAALCRQFDQTDAPRAQRLFEALFDLESDGQERLSGEAFKQELYQIMPALWRQRFSGQPTVLVFDDIHWSDTASIDLLLHLLPLTAEIPLVLLCAFRPERHGPVWHIKTTADEQFRHLYTEISMRPLSGTQVDELIDRLLVHTDMPQSLRARIQERAGGNPFFIEEVIRSLIDSQALVAEEIELDGEKTLYWRATGNGRQIEIPDSLQSLLSSRIDRLQEEARLLIQTAAVIGRTFYRRVLEAVEGPDQGAAPLIQRQLNMLLRLEIIREASRLPELEYVFSNPLTQEVAYQTILLKRRRELHRRAGRALEELFPDQLGKLAPLLAFHFSEGGLKEKALDYYITAGNSAARLFANVEAVDHYTRALGYIDSVDPGSQKLETLFTRRSRALELLSRYEDSLENYQAMLELARQRDDKRLELAAKMAQATIRSIPSPVFDAEISLQLSQDTLELAHELGQSAAEAKIHWNLMLYYKWSRFDFVQTTKHGEAAVRIARESSSTIELGPILNDLALAYVGVGRHEDALQAFEESRILLRESNDLPLLALNHINTSKFQFLIGNNEPARLLLEKAEQINQSVGNTWGLASCQYYWGLMHLVHGRWGEALTALNNCIEFGEKAQAAPTQAIALVAKANYYAFIGAVEPGISFCRQAAQILHQHMPFVQSYSWGAASLLYLNAGDLAAAQESLHKCLADLDLDLPPVPIYNSMEIRIVEIKVRLAEGRHHLAARRADDLLDYLDRFHVRQYQGEAQLLKGKALLAMGQLEEANHSLGAARHLAEELSAHSILWQIFDSQADTLEQLGHPDQAVSSRDQARAELTALASAITEPGDRAIFLKLPDVRRLLEGQG